MRSDLVFLLCGSVVLLLSIILMFGKSLQYADSQNIPGDGLMLYDDALF